MLIACPECSGKVSDKAQACPHCGYPVSSLGSASAEETVIEVSPALFGNNPFTHLFVVLTCLVIIGFIWYFIEWLRCRSTRLTVTTQRTILRSGILAKETNEVRHTDIRNIQVHQGFFDRMLNVGSLDLSSSGQSSVEIVVKGVPDPQGLAALIRKNQ